MYESVCTRCKYPKRPENGVGSPPGVGVADNYGLPDLKTGNQTLIL